MVRTPPFHGGNTSSNLVGVTTLVERAKCDSPSIRWTHLYEISIHTNERNNRCYSRQGQRDWNVSRWIWIMYCKLLVLSGAEKIHASRTKTDQYFMKPQPDEQMLWRAVYKLGKDLWVVTYHSRVETIPLLGFSDSVPAEKTFERTKPLERLISAFTFW